MFINNSTFLLYLDMTSTYDKLHRLIYIEVFPSSCGRFYINIAIYMEINLTTCKLMSGDMYRQKASYIMPYQLKYIYHC